LTRVGATKRPSYRVIAIDKRRSRDGRALEILGFYDPLTEPATVQLDRARIDAWIGKGAQPSETVVKLMRQSERAAAAGAEVEKPKRATRAAKPKPSKKAQAKAASPEATPAAEAAEAPAEVEPAEATEAPAATAAAADAVEPAPEPEPAVDEAAASDEPAAAGDAEKAEA
jgi:small subunit ribosomal protein S16